MRFKKILMILLLTLFSVSLTSCSFISDIFSDETNSEQGSNNDTSSIFASKYHEGVVFNYRNYRVGTNYGYIDNVYSQYIPSVKKGITIRDVYNNTEEPIIKPDKSKYKLVYITSGGSYDSDAPYDLDTVVNRNSNDASMYVYFFYARIGEIEIGLDIRTSDYMNPSKEYSSVTVEVGTSVEDFLEKNNKNKEYFDYDKYKIKYVQRTTYKDDGISGSKDLRYKTDKKYTFKQDDELGVRYYDETEKYYYYAMGIDIILEEKTS